MRKTTLAMAAAAMTLPTLAPVLPAAAEAQGRYHGYNNGYYSNGYYNNSYRNDYYNNGYRNGYDNNGYGNGYGNGYYATDYHGRVWRDSYGRWRCKRSNGTTGMLIGAAGGALIGRAFDTHGSRTAGTIIGAAAGALLGREVERSNNGYRCH